MTDERDDVTKDGRKKWNWKPSAHNEERRRRLAEEERWLELNGAVHSYVADEDTIKELLGETDGGE
jgi:hypothetical protein